MNMLLPALLLSFVVGQPADVPPSASSDELGPAFVDGTYGLSLQPPKGWQLDRHRVPENNGISILKMFELGQMGPVRSIELSIRMEGKSKHTIEGKLARKVQAIEFEHNDAVILSQQVQTIAGKPGAVLSATLFDNGMKRFRMVAIIEAYPTLYLELSYDGPIAVQKEEDQLFSQKKAERLFYLVLGSCRILVDPLEESELATALANGKKWLSTLTGEQLQKTVNGMQYFEILMKGKPIGVIRSEGPESIRRETPGIRIRECTWTFNENGTISRAQVSMFVSNDMESERWKESYTTLIPARDGRAETIENTWQEGLRKESILLTNQTYQISVPPQENPQIRTPKTYLSRGLARLLPRLVGNLDKPRELAFTVFDHNRAGMIFRTLTLKGEAPLPTGVSKGKTYRIEEREGVTALPSIVYVDEAGRVLRIETGDMTIVAAERKDVAARYGSRIQKANAKMTELEKAYYENEERFGR